MSLPSVASMFRKDGALKFLAGSTSTSGQQQVSRRRHGIATCGDAGEVVRAGSALPQRCPLSTVSSKTACTGKRPRNAACKTCLQRCKLQIGFGSTHSTRRAPAADRMREPESAHDGLSIPATWSKARGRWLAPIVSGDLALPRVV